MKKRIWELDALRGLCVMGMVIVHLIYDITDLYGLVHWKLPESFLFLQQWGGVLFLLISGISATLGRKHIKRGLLVFACGMVCTAVTYGMYCFGFSGKGIIIYFGVLHCLGICMLLWVLFKHLPTWALGVIGITLVGLGLWMGTLPAVPYPWLMPIGLPFKGFASADYFPILPHLGFFLLGAVLGRTAYRSRESLLPKVNQRNIFVRFLLFCGKHSLWIYLLHQPLLSGIFSLLLMLK